MSEDRRLDEVIRVRKSPNSFVTMDKSFLEDSRLSYKAKGILAYLLSKPKSITFQFSTYRKSGSRETGCKRKEKYGKQCIFSTSQFSRNRKPRNRKSIYRKSGT